MCLHREYTDIFTFQPAICCKGLWSFLTTEAEGQVLQSNKTVSDPLVFLERALLPYYMAINSVLKTAS